MRRRLDQYFTPTFATKCLLHYFPQIHGNVLEPCSGQNDIAKVLASHFSVTNVRTNDIDLGMASDEHWDATCKQNWGRYNWIVSNPPFSVAAPIVQNAFSSADDGIAMLLRLSFLEPCKGRSEFMSECPPTNLLVLPRISFTGDGNTDSVTLGWFIWAKNQRSTIVLTPAISVVTKEFAMQL